jgi:hypothetical protein
VVALVVSGVLVAAGLYLAFGQPAAEMAALGWLFLVIGAVFLAGNVVLRRKGFRMQRRRPR